MSIPFLKFFFGKLTETKKKSIHLYNPNGEILRLSHKYHFSKYQIFYDAMIMIKTSIGFKKQLAKR